MRVYVDQLAVYFTFTNSIHTQILITPGQHQLEVKAEDKQGYISAIQRVARQGAINLILMIRSKTVMTTFPTVADAGLESTRKHAFERLICEVCHGESASSALL
jgi:hypothetical protein